MDVGRLCGVLATDDHATHQRIAGYVKVICAQYRGMGFSPREEWLAEQVIEALRVFLADVTCTDEERRAIEEFLTLAAEEVAGVP